ncbi:MAG: hypothetical protein KME07_08030 [Pegethrix bostrychoides GSE-TBD4-15B]|jgi:hypothetical protein|uniref:Uncharacterized protein n=1 Tax=Pegethrix bostrychoides GSE-TBD4-15B TaxID=2839662 RepID=A0A951U458_9CYAN|nr:hypothetical protein [Pegethrix bostrychoides GSE-TBD4-15B]
MNTERRPRKSWMGWEEEGKYPNVIIEVLSNMIARAEDFLSLGLCKSCSVPYAFQTGELYSQ